MKENYYFFKTTMPATRKADFYLRYHNDSVFIDFDCSKDGLIFLKRISFDSYGCCDLNNDSISLNAELSKEFLYEIKKVILNQEKIRYLVFELIKLNQNMIWRDALEEYNLIAK